nr:hypothetical protein [Methylobacterium radiodurans]
MALGFGATAAEAKGCLKGAVVGGVAGYAAGHGKAGAAAGCAIGHHEAGKKGRQPAQNGQPQAQ